MRAHATAQIDAAVQQALLQLQGKIGIHRRQNALPTLQHDNAAAEQLEALRHLHADRAATNQHQAIRHAIQRQQLLGCMHARQIAAGKGRHQCLCASGQNGVRKAQRGRRAGGKNVALARQHMRPVDGGFHGDGEADAKLGSAIGSMQTRRAFAKDLGRDAAFEQAGAAQTITLLDQHHATTRLCQRQCRRGAARTAADHQYIDHFILLRHCAHARYCPPLIDSVAPVMKPDCSCTRNATACAISSGCARRPTGICAIMPSSTLASMPATISVAV